MSSVNPNKNEMRIPSSSPPHKPVEKQPSKVSSVGEELFTSLMEHAFESKQVLYNKVTAWNNELSSIKIGGVVDYSSKNHLAVLEESLALISSYRETMKLDIPSNLRKQLLDKTIDELKMVTRAQKEISGKINDYFEKYLQCAKSQVESPLQSDESWGQDFQNSVATFEYFSNGLKVAIQEMRSLSKSLEGELQKLAAQESLQLPLTVQASKLLGIINEDLATLRRISTSIVIQPAIAENLAKAKYAAIDVAKSWDSLEIWHTFFLKYPNMITLVTNEVAIQTLNEKPFEQIEPLTSSIPIRFKNIFDVALAALWYFGSPAQNVRSATVDELEASSLHANAGTSHKIELPNSMTASSAAQIEAVVHAQPPLMQDMTSSVQEETCEISFNHAVVPWKMTQEPPSEVLPLPIASSQQVRSAIDEIILAAGYAELKRLSTELEALEHLPKDFAFSQELAMELSALNDRISGAQWELNQLFSQNLSNEKQSKKWMQKVEVLLTEIISYNTLLENFQIKGLNSALGEHHLKELIHFLSAEPDKISNQLLLHISGDPYGEKTSLEGGESTQNLRYLLATLSKRIAVLSDKSICTDEQRVGYCQALFHDSQLAQHLSLSANLETFFSLKNQISKAIELGEALSGNSFENYHALMSDAVNFKLNDVGDSFFYPINWPKHALALEVIKDLNDLFTIRIYNTGAGSEVQGNCKVETTDRMLPFTEITGVTERKIKDPLFHNLLWRLAHATDEKMGPEELYGPIISSLEGISSIRSFSIEEYIHPQRSGTCSYAVLNAVFSQLMTNTLHPKRFDWEFQFKTITDFYKEHLSALPNDQITRNNLLKALSEFAIVTKNLQISGVITPSEAAFTARKMESISQAINVAQKKYEEVRRNQRLNFDKISQKIVFPEKKGIILVQNFYDDLYQEYWSGDMYPSRIKSSTPMILISQEFIPFLIVDQLASFIADHREKLVPGGIEGVTYRYLQPKLIMDQLVTFIDGLRGKPVPKNIGDIMHRYLQSKEFIQNLPGVSDTFWEQVPEKDLSNAIELIGDLSFRFFHSVMEFSVESPEREMMIPTSDFIIALKLLTLLDKLTQRIAVSDGTPRYNLYQKSFDEILFSRNPKVSINDPLSIRLINDLRAYWENRKPLKIHDDEFISFFGVEITHQLFGLMMFSKVDNLSGMNIGKTIFGKPVKHFHKWEFQQWARDYLARNIEKQVAFKNIFFPNQVGLEELAMLGIGTQLNIKYESEATRIPKILPLDFYTSRDVSILAHYFLSGMLKKGVEKIFEKDRLDVEVEFLFGDKYSTMKFLEYDNPLAQQYSDLSACRTPWSGSLECVNSPQIGHMFANTPPPSEAVDDIWAFAELRRRHSPADIFGKSLKNLDIKEATIAALGKERIQELLFLSSDSKTQVSDTISYFAQHRNFLSDPQLGWLFEHLIFEPPLLMEALEKDSFAAKQLVGNLANLLNRGYADFLKEESGDFVADSDEAYVLFIVHLNRVCEEYVNDVSERQPDIFSNHFTSPLPDAKKKMMQFLEKSTSTSLKSMISRELTISYGNSPILDEADLILFLTANVDAHLIPSELIDNLTRLELQMAVAKQRSRIEHLLGSDDKKNELINSVLGKFISNFNPQNKWNYFDTFPLIANDDGQNKIVFNIIEGKIWTYQGMIGSLPSEIAQNPILSSLKLNIAQTEVHSIGENLWSLKDQNGVEYRVDSRVPIFQKLIGENWYQLDETKNIAIEALRRDKLQWVFKNSNDNTLVHIEDALTHKPIALVELKIYDESVIIHKLDSITGATTNLILDNPDNKKSELHFLTDIEDANEILFWREKKSEKSDLFNKITLWREKSSYQPMLIELPRLGVSFKSEIVGDELTFVSEVLGGYGIAKKQSHESMGDAMHYLVLEKGFSKRILIPRKPYQALKEEEGASSLEPVSILDSSGDQHRFFIYKIDPKTSRLTFPSNEARYFLAMIHLWHHKYKEALDLIKGGSSRIKQLTGEEREVMEWIANLSAGNLDHTPEAAVVQLHANILLLRNARDFGFSKRLPLEKSYLEDEDFLTSTFKNYRNYLSEVFRWGDFILPPDEELFLIKEILQAAENRISLDITVNNLLVSRQQQLQGKKTLPLKCPKINLHKKLLFDTTPPFSISLLDLVEVFDPNTSTPSGNLLEPTFGNIFLDAYQVAREDDDILKLRKVIKKLTGLTYPLDENKEFLMKEFDRILHLIEILPKDNSDKSQLKATILRNVLADPKKFPSTESLEKNRLNIDWIIKNLSNKFQRISIVTEKQIVQPSITYPRTITPVTLSKSTEVVPGQTHHMVSQIAKPLIEEFFVPDTITYIAIAPPKDLTEAKKGLLDSFYLKTDDSVAERMLTDIRKRVSDYAGPAEAQSYLMLDWQKVYQLGQHLKEEFALEDHYMVNLQGEIEEILNKPAVDVSVKAEDRLEKASAHKHDLDVNDAIFYYLRRSSEVMQKLNPHIIPADLKWLLEKVQTYLMLSTNQQHRSRIVSIIDEISAVKCIASGDPECAIPEELINKLGREMNSKRAYDISQHPEYLVLEHYMEKIFWTRQVEALEKLRIEKGRMGSPEFFGVALELIMASGKSSVLLPLLSLLHADGEHLAIGVMPASLLPEASEEMHRVIGKAFRQVLEVIKIDRDRQLDTWGLKALYSQLQTEIKKRRTILMSDADVKSLYLKFSEALYQLNHSPAGSSEKRERLAEITEFRRIFQLFKKAGIVTIDEIDTIGNVLFSHHFSIGQPSAPPSAVFEGTDAFFRAFMSIPKIKERFINGAGSLASVQEFDPLQANAETESLSITAAKEILTGSCFSAKSEIGNYLRSLAATDKSLVEQYLMGSNEEGALNFIHDKVKSQNIQDVLAVIREQISALAPLTISKRLLQHFGPPMKEEPLKFGTELISAPYDRGNPSKNSQFGTDLEMVDYTYLQSLIGIQVENQGVRHVPKIVIEQELEGLRQQLLIEKYARKNSPVEQLATYTKLMQYFDKNPSSLNILKKFPEAIIRKASAKISQDPGLIIELVTKQILPHLVTYPIQLNANAQIYKFMFGVANQFSGTLWNMESLPSIYRSVEASDTSEKTLFLIESHSPKHVPVIDTSSGTQSLHEVIAQLYASHKDSSSIIDAAGAMLSWENEQVAKEMLIELQKKHPSLLGVAYCDKNNRWLVWTGSGAPHSLATSSLSSGEIAVYWDLAHTTGADVPTRTYEQAITLIGKHTILRDLFQGVWRLRKFDQGQSSAFAVEQADANVIKEVLSGITGVKIVGELELKHLLQYAIYNQAKIIGDHNYRALVYRLEAALIEQVWNLMLDPSLDDRDIGELFKHTESLFLSTTAGRPYEMYGRPQSKKTREIVVQELLKGYLDGGVMSFFSSHPKWSARIILTELKGKLIRIAEEAIPLLPETILSGQNYGLQRQVQTQTQTQKDTNLNTQKDTRKDIEEVGLLHRKDKIQWRPDGLFTKAYFGDRIKDSEVSDVSQIRAAGSQSLVSLSTYSNAWKIPGEFAPNYTPGLLSTINLTPMHLFPKSEAAPMAKSQQSFRKMLVIQDKQTGLLEAVLLNKDDLKHFEQKLLKDSQGNHELDMALYDLETGFESQSFEPIKNIESIETSPEFLKLKVQAKFFAGRSYYDDYEMVELKAWLVENDPQKMYAYFTGKVLLGKEDSLKDFSYSALYRAFDDLGVNM
ncbi:MAG: DUF3638 domain-containing protein [Parachlamydiaceae bacterium]|nr:DUF3638 domain-containing protein [Parachlamydiaceae bacterium]